MDDLDVLFVHNKLRAKFSLVILQRAAVRLDKVAPLNKIPHFLKQGQQMNFFPRLHFHARQHGNAGSGSSPQSGRHIVAAIMIGNRQNIDSGSNRMTDDVPRRHFDGSTRRQQCVHM